MASEDARRLVSRVLARETDAFDQFVSGFRPFVYGLLIRSLRLGPEEADEIFQQFLVHLWEDDFRRLRQWRGDTSLAAYLAAVVRNLARDHRRRQRWTSPLDDREPASRDRGGEDAAIKKMTLHAALSRLSARDRALLHSRHFLGHTYREMAKAFGMTTSNVGVALSRAETRLRREFERISTGP